MSKQGEKKGVDEQINHMIAFIKSEAKEKCQQIEAETEQDFTVEKQRQVEAEKQKIDKEYERKSKQIEVEKRIAHSNAVKASRLRVLKERDRMIQEVYHDTAKALVGTASNKSVYKPLVKNLILQGCYKLQEDAVTIRCRKEDEDIVKSLLKETESEYLKKMGSKCTLSISSEYLPPGPGKAEGISCIGGVVLEAMEGRIKCSNTLDDRLKLFFENQLPVVRQALFSE